MAEVSTEVKLERPLKKHKKKMPKEDVIFYIFNTIFLVLFAIVTLYPVLNTLAYSFNDGNDAIRGGIHFLPRRWSIKNYNSVLTKEGILVGAKITVLRTILGTLTSLFANALLSFILSRKKFLFKSSLSLFWIITMYASGGLVPTMILFRYLHLTESFWVYVIPGMVSAFNVMVMRTYMEGIPDSLEESAMLEGAGYMTVFSKIISPLCKPVYATIALFVAVYHWNAWFDAMLYNRMNPEYTTLQYELMKLLNNVSATSSGPVGASQGGQTASAQTVTPITIRAAATIATMAPIIALYPFLQRYFVTGLTIGGVKE
ncbi:MAG: carbohydrate ABC transporter permease [Clostridiales bacterium]|nr:carbohydrate ABC transporter permease [Clostridiales bacterium]